MKKVFIHLSEQKYFYWLTIGTWTLLAIFMSSQLYVRMNIGNNKASWLDVIPVEFVYSYSYLLLSPIMLWLSYKLPFDKSGWLKSSLIHVVLAIFSSIIILGVRRYVQWLIIDKTVFPLSFERVFNSIYYSMDYGVMSYLLVAFFSYTYMYYNQFRQRELKASQLEFELAQAQLQTLKMQLQPHFLFNTLNSISALVRKNENETATKMIAGLGNFLRLTLENQSEQEVELQKEIELLKLYLEIQKVRFNDRLEISYNIDPDLLNVKIPNLILQPLVENAIKHGLADKTTIGHLSIIAARENGNLRIKVSDDGIGINDELENLKNKGIGLLNTEARLEKLYGNSFKFDLKNNPNGGVDVILEIPAII
ncbi:MAG: histidine kinase [Ignavibacteriales bacterium]|nr:histidine kinase [Ignavibacteriales bacterium]